MNARRARFVAVLAVAFVALPMGTAHAAGTGQVTTPASGATLTSPTPITIEVTGRSGSFLDPQDHVVRVRLADHTGATIVAGTSDVAATCETDCDDDSTWTVASFDPATLAPFGSAPSCNGGYTVQVQVDGGPWTGNAVRIARAPGAPRDVAVSGGVGEATVTWKAPSDPDVVGYRVERRTGSGSWTQVAQVAPGTRSVTDDGVAAGEVDYRVSTLRGDGLVSGQPAAPCSDDAPDLATASGAVTATVRSTSTSTTSTGTTAPSRPSPSDSPSADDTDDTDGTGGSGGDGTADGGTDGGTGDGTATPDDGQTPTDDGATADGTDDGAGTPTRRPGNRVAPPSRVGTVAAPDVSVPGTPAADRPQVATDEERYYGEGEAFSEELDFGDLGEVDVEALGDGPATTRVVRVPGALQAVFGEELALDRVLAPVAGGMIMLAFALHLRRWTREGMSGG